MKDSYIRKFCLFIVIFICYPVFAGKKIEESRLVGDTLGVKVCNDRGNITFKSWSKPQVLIKGTLDDLADNLVFEKQDKLIIANIVINSKYAHGKNNGKGSQLEVWIPENYNIEFKGIATDLNIEKIQADVSIKSVTGVIDLKRIDGHLSVKSMSGKINLNEINGDVDLYTVSGNITAKLNSNKVKIQSVSSDVNVENALIKELQVSSVTGKTQIAGELNENARVILDNVSGESLFFAKSNLVANLSLKTGADGTIENQLVPYQKQESHINRQEQVIIATSSNKHIIMNTVNGKISIKKQVLTKK